MDSTPSPNSAWLTIISSIAAAVGALLAKKRFTRKPPGSPASGHGSLVTLTEFHQVLDALRDKMDANPNALALGLKSGAVEKSDLRDTYDLLRLTLESSSSPNSPPQPSTLNNQLLSLALELHRLLKS
jgi:hypothetical protein